MEAICTVLLLTACLSAAIAHSRGHNVAKWFVIGAGLGPFGYTMAQRLPNLMAPRELLTAMADKEKRECYEPMLMVVPAGFSSVIKALLACAICLPLVAATTLLQSAPSLHGMTVIVLACVTVAATYVGLRLAPIWHVFPRRIAFAISLSVIGLAAAAIARGQAQLRADAATLVTTALLCVLALAAPLLLNVRPARAIDVGNPLLGRSWITIHAGWSPLMNAHSAAPAQRFAMDAVVLSNGRRAEGIIPEDLAVYHSFGTEVASPVTGTVVECKDGMPDQAPCYHDPYNPAGNFVRLSIEAHPHIHILIAHLKNGTISVHAGERVAQGAIVGRVGNSGNTSEPHLHLHAEDQRTGKGVPITVEGRWMIRNSTFDGAKRRPIPVLRAVKKSTGSLFTLSKAVDYSRRPRRNFP